MTAIPMAMPLEHSRPGPIHSTPDGRAWYGHSDRVNPDTGMLEEASFTLTTAPRQGDDLWIDANAITTPLAQPLPAPQPADWPTLDDLDRQIAEARAALAGAPRFRAAAAKAKAEAACWRAQEAIEVARIAVAEAVAAAAREQSDDTEWPGGPEDDQPDLSELDSLSHPSLSPAERNRR